MRMTVNEANRLAQQLKAEHDRLLEEERNVQTYSHTEGEEPFIPKYDFAEMAKKRDEINGKIQKIRHAVSLFNVSEQISAENITVDQALVRIAMLSAEKRRLDHMVMIPEVNREGSYRTPEIVHCNFDMQQVELRREAVTMELNQLRAALDLVNLTRVIDIDL